MNTSSSYRGPRPPEPQGHDNTANMSRHEGHSNNYAQQSDTGWNRQQFQSPAPSYGNGPSTNPNGAYPDHYRDDPNMISSNFGDLSLHPSAYQNQRNPSPHAPTSGPPTQYPDHGPQHGGRSQPMVGGAGANFQRRPPPGAERPGTADGWRGRPHPPPSNQRRPPQGSAMPLNRDGPGPYAGQGGRPPHGRGQPPHPPYHNGPMQFHRPRPPPPSQGGGWPDRQDGFERSQRYDRPGNGPRDLARSQTMPQRVQLERIDSYQNPATHQAYASHNPVSYNEPSYPTHDAYRGPEGPVDSQARGFDSARGSVGDVLDLYAYDDPYGSQPQHDARSNSLRNDGHYSNNNHLNQQPPLHPQQSGAQAHRSKSQPNLRSDGPPNRPYQEPPLPFPLPGQQQGLHAGDWGNPTIAGSNEGFAQMGHSNSFGTPDNSLPPSNHAIPELTGTDPSLLRSRPVPQRVYSGHNPRDLQRSMQPPSTSTPARETSGDPDALPEHPAPIRPGLASDNASIRSGASHSTSATSHIDPSVAQGQMSVHDVGPVTLDMLNLMRNEIASKPANQPANPSIQLGFAKRLVEASFALVNDSDPKAARRSRENFILEAHKIIKKISSAPHPYPEAMFYLATCYGDGSLGLEVDHDRAFSLYQSAAKLNHPASAYRTAVCCEIGAGTKKEIAKAIQWYKKAAALGDTAAMYKLGIILHKGLLGVPRNDREAIVWMKRAAEQADEQNPHALHQLGLLYESADGNGSIVRDVGYAKELFTRAAELGYPRSQYRLGAAYAYGLIDCPVDAKLSITWYSRAAAGGDAESELALAGWYLTGAEGVLEQNDTEAYLWSRKAAEQGLAKAEFAVGHLTELGIGLDGKGSEEEARNWYFRAAGQGHPKAKERLEEMRRGTPKKSRERLSRHNKAKDDADCVVM